MAYPTNVVALVESDFLANARELMKDREKASPFGVWGRGREVESSTPLHEVWEDLGSGVLSSITSQA